MITQEIIEHEDYTVFITLNDELKRRGGQFIVHGTLVMKGTETHRSIGKINSDDWRAWAEASALRVSLSALVPSGSVFLDWK